jgi:hypothetical protein
MDPEHTNEVLTFVQISRIGFILSPPSDKRDNSLSSPFPPSLTLLIDLMGGAVAQ